MVLADLRETGFRNVAKKQKSQSYLHGDIFIPSFIILWNPLIENEIGVEWILSLLLISFLTCITNRYTEGGVQCSKIGGVLLPPPLT